MPKAKETKKESSIVKPFIGGMSKMNIRIIFIEELLGATPSDKEIYSSFIGKNASDDDLADEISKIGPEGVIENGTTRFLMVDNKPALSNHTWLGFFKEKIGLIKLDDKSTASGKMSNYKKRIDVGVGFSTKYSILVPPKGQTVGICQRPLRAQTMSGERIALASSITVPPRTRTRFTLHMMSSEYIAPIKEALHLGRYTGTGQWRGSGKKGRFLWEEFDDDGNIIDGNTESVCGCTTQDPGFKESLENYIASEEYGEIEEEFE